MSFEDSYLGRLRRFVGSDTLMSGGVRLLVEDNEGRFLTIRRADDGKWGLPAGAMELSESLMDAAARELFEETNLRLHDPVAFGLCSDPATETHEYPNGDRVQYISLLVHSGVDDTAPLANDGEARALRFHSLAEISALDFTEAERPAFDHWKRFCATGIFQIA
ncbi:NUDIX domain-containing protein [Sulfitobacter sp. HNIBRBA3233]|uniref:NUDIX domain-containing protein n=1 Tax=Sulfitobacter marinivivus TaxID=3158558 RepID=UPI0032DFAC03